MPIDQKTWMASLVAVFLALALGVVIGSALQGDRVLVERQRMMIQGLETEFENIRRRTRSYEEELRRLEAGTAVQHEVIKSLAPLAVSGRLEETSVAVILIDAGHLQEDLEQLLSWAGSARPWWIIVQENMWTDSDEARVGLKRIVEAVIAGDSQVVADLKAQGNHMRQAGEPSAPEAVAVIYGGINGALGQGFGLLFDELLNPARATPARPSDTLPRLVGAITEPAAKLWDRPPEHPGFTAVERVDSTLGQVALVLALVDQAAQLMTEVGENAEMDVDGWKPAEP